MRVVCRLGAWLEGQRKGSVVLCHHTPLGMLGLRSGLGLRLGLGCGKGEGYGSGHEVKVRVEGW